MTEKPQKSPSALLGLFCQSLSNWVTILESDTRKHLVVIAPNTDAFEDGFLLALQIDRVQLHILWPDTGEIDAHTNRLVVGKHRLVAPGDWLR